MTNDQFERALQEIEERQLVLQSGVMKIMLGQGTFILKSG